MSNANVKTNEEEQPVDAKMNKVLLNSMSRRRMSCTEAVQQLWDAVKVIRYQRQVANSERIAKYMLRAHGVQEEEVTRQLGYCVRDGLLLITKKIGFKGSKVGVEQEGYALPESHPERDKHDWYCAECHTGGDVICCAGCHRVYHLSCISNLHSTKHKYICSACQICEAAEELPVKLSRLNKLIYMVCTVLKERYRFLLNSSSLFARSINIGAPGAQIDIGSESWRIKLLLYRVVDISIMMAKARSRDYTSLNQFLADATTIVHNVVIFHGVHSHRADGARQMLRDCHNEVNHIRACYQCYTAAHRRSSRNWFCKPCHPPHQLVYAKAKGQGYWPAKVQQTQGDKYDVMFFGSTHNRATVDKSCIQPITSSPTALQVKRSPSWSRACEELKKHQELLKKEVNLDDSSSSSEDESISQRSSKSMSQKSSSKLSKDSDSERGRDSSVEDNKRSSSGEDVKRYSSLDEGKQPSVSPFEDLGMIKSEEEGDDDDDEDDDEDFRLGGRPKGPKKKKKRSGSGAGSTGAASPRKRGPVRNVEPAAALKKRRGRPPKSKSELAGTPLVQLAPPGPKEPCPVDVKGRRGRPPGSKNKKKKVSPLDGIKDDESTEVKDGGGSSSGAGSVSTRLSPVLGLGEDDEEPLSKRVRESDKPERKDKSDKSKKLKEDDSHDDDFQKPESTTSLNKSQDAKKNEEEIVSSSCTEPQFRSIAVQTKAEKDGKKELIAKLEEELEALKTSHAEEIKQLQVNHSQEITITKKKQWCYNCEQEAIYHCCWNTAYCSTECQQVHWQREHKRVCRRKR